MKVTVKVSFIDKHTREVHQKGDVLTINKARFAEIQSVGDFVEEIKTTKEATEAE